MENNKAVVKCSIWIDAPPEQVWQAVTQPEKLNQWYAKGYHWEIPALQVNTPVRFYNKDNDADYLVATIEVLDLIREFTLEWQPDPYFPAMTLVTRFLLEEENDGTRMTLFESGYEALSESEREKWLAATRAGYTLSAENLKALLEGNPICMERV